MSGITIKIASLLIRTLAKPISNQIKVQAREHDRFRAICVNFAQSVHRVDMRLRLGLLQDHAAIERQIARDAKEAAAKKALKETPTVKTEAQTKADELKTAGDEVASVKAEKKAKEPKIKPLVESKAIELGANFFSESFIFMVALGVLVFERWYSNRKEKGRRNDLAENLAELEERDRLHGVELELLKQEVEDLRARNQRYWRIWKNVAGDDAEQKAVSPADGALDSHSDSSRSAKDSASSPGEKQA